MRLLWPTNYPDFHLEFSTNPPAGNWFAALPLPAVLGTNYVVTNSTAGAEFSSAAVPVAWYRLGENDPGAASGPAVTNTTSDSVGGNHLKEFGGPLYTDAVSSEAADQVASSLVVQLNGSSQFRPAARPASARTHPPPDSRSVFVRKRRRRNSSTARSMKSAYSRLSQAISARTICCSIEIRRRRPCPRRNSTDRASPEPDNGG